MKLNSDTANKIIKNTQAEIETLLAKENIGKTYTYASGEDIYKEPYSFPGTQERLTALRQKVMKLRHAINVFNISTTLPEFGCTIDEALFRMSVMNADKRRLYSLLQIPEKTRNRSFGGKEADYTCRNFDVSEVQAEYDKVCIDLMTIQQAINVANLTIYFDVDI